MNTQIAVGWNDSRHTCKPVRPGFATVSLSALQHTVGLRVQACICTAHNEVNTQQTNHTHTHCSSSLLAPGAVSHPSIHVTERRVHPVTGQLVAVTLVYVAPLGSLFLLWWRDHVCSLPIRKVYSAHHVGGPVSDGSRERRPCVNKLYHGSPPGQHHLVPALLLFCHRNQKPKVYRHIVPFTHINLTHCDSCKARSKAIEKKYRCLSS